jgi:hypothetical protein
MVELTKVYSQVATTYYYYFGTGVMVRLSVVGIAICAVGQVAGERHARGQASAGPDRA